MSQRVSQTIQEQIDELVQRTQEKDEERKKKKRHSWSVELPVLAKVVRQNLIRVKRPPRL